VNWEDFCSRFKATLIGAITKVEVYKLYWQNFCLRFYKPRLTATIPATELKIAALAAAVKSFAVELRTKRLTDLPDLASKIIGEAVACVDQRLGKGGWFTSCSNVKGLRINDQPALQFFAGARGVNFAVSLTGTVVIYLDDSIQLHMDFHDANGWRVRESEELAAHTLSCLHSALARFQFHGDVSEVRWHRTCGNWNHGVLVPPTVNQP
jgi:hypothetical protein